MTVSFSRIIGPSPKDIPFSVLTRKFTNHGTYSYTVLNDFSHFFENCTETRDLSFFKVCNTTLFVFGPIDPLTSGHERSLTQIKFNQEGDLLFSCSKDHIVNVWFTHNGERLGTYDGHNGTVWTIDVDCGYFFFPCRSCAASPGSHSVID